MALHEQCVGATDEWYTPPHVFDALGCRFDMDVASPGLDVTPWIPTGNFLAHNSVSRNWFGFVWMNPPFGGRNGLLPWIDKFFKHRDGIALVPDRTSAPWWQKAAALSDAILFISPKLKFIGADGKPGKSPAQGTCLLAAGDRAVQALSNAEFVGLGILFESGSYRSLLAEHELMRRTLETIAGSAADQLQATQARGALANIGPAFASQGGKTP